VEEPIKKLFENLAPKENYDIRMIPFKTIQARLPQIYETKEIVDYEKSINYKKRTPKARRKE
jgi:hypothetical protein